MTINYYVELKRIEKNGFSTYAVESNKQRAIKTAQDVFKKKRRTTRVKHVLSGKIIFIKEV